MKRCLLLLLLFPLFLGAQEVEGDFLFVTGTTYRNPDNGRDWVWLSWQAPDPQRLQNLKLSIHRKAGDFSAAGAYALQSVSGFQQDPRVVKMLLGRGEMLGGNTAELVQDIRSMFQDLTLAPGLTDEELILTVMLGSQANADDFANLVLLARKHPGLALCTGLAHAQLMDGVKESFELRAYDADAGQAGAVFGRVTLSANAPRILPAAVNLDEVPETRVRGDLNIRLRWEEPDELKRVALLQFGYNVYRMEAAAAEDRNLDTDPLDREGLLVLLQEDPPVLEQVNRLPVMPNADADEKAPFFVDDHNRFDEGGQPFPDGATYYYWVVARDQLGRLGHPSNEVRVQVCDRFPPPVPRNVRVQRSRSYDANTDSTTNRLKVIWTQNPDDPEDPTTQYYVYKWESMAEANFRGRDPAQNLFAGPIPHQAGESTNFIYDETIADEDFGKNFLYTVRAVDGAICGDNYSGHSGPGQGHLQDWDGAGAPTGVVRIRCDRLELKFEELVTMSQVEGRYPYEIEVFKAPTTKIDWVEVRWTTGKFQPVADVDAATSLGRYYFGDTLSHRIGTPASEIMDVTYFARVGRGEKVSPWVGISEGMDSSVFPSFVFKLFRFEALQFFDVLPVGEDCDEHIPGGGVNPGDPITDFPITDIEIPDDGAEYRLYRKVNGGEPVLWAQGNTLAGALISGLEDDTLGSPSCAEICILAQVINKHGLAGPLVELGCFSTSTRPPAAPQISPARPAGDEQNPKLELRWFASPYSAEYFEVEVASEEPLPQSISPELSDNFLPSGSLANFVINGEARQLYIGRYLTGRVGTSFGTPGSPEFTLTLPIAKNDKRVYRVYARGACGNSDPSVAIEFQWTAPSLGPEVPWPARPLPSVLNTHNYGPLFAAVYLGNHPLLQLAVEHRVGLVIGEFAWSGETSSQFLKLFSFQNVLKDPVEYLFTDSVTNDPLFPGMLFRMQEPSDLFPQVSGDLIQVSPLMEKIAHRFDGSNTLLLDPYILALPEAVANPQKGVLLLRDTQPVIRGAQYRYYYLQFTDRMEVSRVIRLNTVEVPE